VKKTLIIFALASAVALTAGCFEDIYLSGAPDGTIALSVSTNGGAGLLRINPEMTTATLVAENVARAEYSPDGKKLFCALGSYGQDAIRYELAVCDVDGKVETVVDGFEWREKNSTPMMELRWSPDGKYVSYLMPHTTNADELVDLHIKQPAGPYHLVIPKVAFGYAWSLDSKEVAVVATDAEDVHTTALGSVQLWDVEKKERTAEPAGVFFYPWLWTAWQSETTILFSAHKVEMPLAGKSSLEAVPISLFSVTRGGADMRDLLGTQELSSGDYPGMFDISPDKKRIAYVVWLPRKEGATFEGPAGELYVANADGSNVLKVAEASQIQTPPRWLDTRRVACAMTTKSGDKEESHIYVIEPGVKTVDLMPLIAPLVAPKEASPAGGVPSPSTASALSTSSEVTTGK